MAKMNSQEAVHARITGHAKRALAGEQICKVFIQEAFSHGIITNEQAGKVVGMQPQHARRQAINGSLNKKQFGKLVGLIANATYTPMA